LLATAKPKFRPFRMIFKRGSCGNARRLLSLEPLSEMTIRETDGHESPDSTQSRKSEPVLKLTMMTVTAGLFMPVPLEGNGYSR